jgi:hypothetical protein
VRGKRHDLGALASLRSVVLPLEGDAHLKVTPLSSSEINRLLEMATRWV